MSRWVKNYLRSNADQIAAKYAGEMIVFGKEGNAFRANAAEVQGIMRDALRRHCLKPSRPTLVPLSMAQARAFPLFKGNEGCSPRVWLAIASDAAGNLGMGLCQEGRKDLCRRITSTAARAQAQAIACEHLAKMTKGIGPVQGNA